MEKNFSKPIFSSHLSNSKQYLLLFVFWPFLSFCLALTNYSEKVARKVVYIFLIYYGLTFVVGQLGGAGSDSERYAMALKTNAELPFSDFFKIVGGLYTSDTSVDIVEPLISFIVSRFTDHYSVYFAIWAAIFGFFYLKSINLLHNRYQEKPGWNALIFMSFFIVILPITAINGVRMWTAAWIFFYGAYHVVLYRNPRYLLIALAASLVHWSFISANMILLIYFFAGNRNLIYLPLALASFVVPQIINPYIQLVSQRFGGGIQSRIESYTSENYIMSRQLDLEQATWFIKLGDSLVFYYLLLAIIIVQLRYSYLMKEKPERNLYNFLLLFMSFVNFGMDIPSLGRRFQIIFFLFATFYVFLYFLKQSGDKVNLITLVGLFPMALYAAITFRQGSESINAWLFTPGLGLPLLVPALSVADFLFQ